MNTIATKDGTTIYFKEWGLKNGPVVTFSHGWPLSADAWEAQMFFLASHGSRRIAHDRPGHGRVPPIMVKTAANPGGLPMEVFDGFRAAYLADRAQFFPDVASGPFFGFNRPGAKVSQGLIQSWWLQGMMTGHKNAHDCIKAFSKTDFTGDLKKFDKPTLIIHGDDDQIVPIDAAGPASAKLIKGAKPIVSPGAPHGLTDTHKDKGKLNADLLEFIKA